ncbi:enoyl-CoA hydratase/isomerase family protein [Rhodococcoides fascians]|uniref:enoyl-CoA hydratase/isomerase family protein n=1 Tax=Rhodococcoides fascians TaxID=1828 RepID=UPI00050C245A|nr:enoyl-CoA hydratase/isomerase family protein [Rhodococcus fascians]
MKLIEDALVLLEQDEQGIAHITLNRPEASNGMSLEFLQALHRAVMMCHAREDIRVVLLTAAGRNFCAGGDVHEFASRGEALPEYIREVGAWLQAVGTGLINLRAPVVTAVHGFAAGGGGLGLVCASDIVVASRSARFMSGAARVGMAPDAGTTTILTQLVGLRQTMRILLTNPTLGADEAASLGLISEIVEEEDLLSRARSVAAELAACAPLSMSAIKNLVWRGASASIEGHMADEARVVAQLSGTHDSREGLAAVREKRAPTFVGR